MTVPQYLENLVFNEKRYTLTPEEAKTLQFEGLEVFIWNKLTSRKYRESKVVTELEKKVKEKISATIKLNKPIHITIPFGGFKKWQFVTYPNIDWAEVFNVCFLIEYLLPISLAYKPGVILDYFSDEIFISRMNNYPQTDIDIYNEQMQQLLSLLQATLPKNFKLKYSKIRDQISQEELFKRFENDIIDLKKTWADLPIEERDLRLKKTERNYYSNWKNINKLEKDTILFESTMIHDAFIYGKWDLGVPWAFDIDMIPIGFRYTGKWGLPIKSCSSSTVQFWVGTGVVVHRKGNIVPTILTYEQYKKFNDEMKVLSLNTSLSKISPALQKISILHR